MYSGTAFISRGHAKRYFGNDAAWFEQNVPFFECSDSLLEEVYQYRWKLYKAHIRDLGSKGTVITEFLDDVGWQKHPYAMLNDATSFHIYEGRWLRDRQYIDSFLDFLYPGGGNDRHFAESIADAAHAHYLAHGDKQVATKHLSAMKHIFNLWDDHFDFSKGLYFIEPLLDATEYTVSSIDASDGKDGFRGGDAFRPTINSYMVANARAISRFSELIGDSEGAKDYAERAERLRKTMQDSLWNDALGYFCDRYKVHNEHVHYWEFIRDRELAGYVPWAHSLPDDTEKYAGAWQYMGSESHFAGKAGLRTIGPSYQYYMRQYRYLGKAPECQWNGPSWPFQTTQVLLGLANILNNYEHAKVGRSDYLRVLRQYAKQHYLDGKLNLQEDYHPETGKPIVGLDRSHHYNHSGFTDLIITGLCGLRPRADDILEVNPLIEKDIQSFCLENVPYHGNLVTIVWDADGSKYRQGTGLSVFVNGTRLSSTSSLGKVTVPISTKKTKVPPKPRDTALNIYRVGSPQPIVSSGEETKWQAVDGRAWFFAEMIRGWQPDASSKESWFQVAYEKPTKVSQVALSLYDDGQSFRVPESHIVQTWDGSAWTDAAKVTAPPPGNTSVVTNFKPVRALGLRVVFQHSHPLCLVAISTALT